MRATAKPEVEKQPGAYMPDGTYNPEAGMGHRGVTDHFVRAMVKSRRGPGFTPELAAEAVQLARQEVSFPNWSQWAKGGEWREVRTSTSAEEAVKRCGFGVIGPNGEKRDWNGEQWGPT